LVQHSAIYQEQTYRNVLVGSALSYLSRTDLQKRIGWYSTQLLIKNILKETHRLVQHSAIYQEQTYRNVLVGSALSYLSRTDLQKRIGWYITKLFIKNRLTETYRLVQHSAIYQEQTYRNVSVGSALSYLSRTDLQKRIGWFSTQASYQEQTYRNASIGSALSYLSRTDLQKRIGWYITQLFIKNRLTDTYR